MKNLILLFFLLTFPFYFFNNFSYGADEWEKHSEAITILETEEVQKIVNSKSALLLDVWKKDIRPEKLDPKKWMPAQRYSIPGSKWVPNIGLETLTPELRNYLETTVERLTKGDKNTKLVCFCRRGYYSKIAAERLVKMGYTNIFLYPGTDLWEDSGKRLVIVKAEKMTEKK